MSAPYNFYGAVAVFSTLVWFVKIFVMRYTLKALLTYHGWMFEPRGKMSLLTKIWLVNLIVLFIVVYHVYIKK